jgi:hypothetical protein
MYGLSWAKEGREKRSEHRNTKNANKHTRTQEKILLPTISPRSNTQAEKVLRPAIMSP